MDCLITFRQERTPNGVIFIADKKTGGKWVYCSILVLDGAPKEAYIDANNRLLRAIKEA